MNCIENGMYANNGFSTEAHKNFPIHYGLCGKKILKRILTYLDCTKYNEINIGHSHIQKHVFYRKNDIKSANIKCTGSHKSFHIHYSLWGGIFKAYFSKLIFH